MRNKSAFTLLEILVVVGLIGLLTAIGSFGYVNYAQKARDSRRQIDMQQLRSALELYRSNNSEGVYPTAAEYGSGTSSVLVSSGLVQTIPVDPRGAAYTYTPLPAGCDNTSNYCTSYTLQTTLEVTSQPYIVTPMSIK